MNQHRRNVLQASSLALLGFSGLSDLASADEQKTTSQKTDETENIFIHVFLLKFKPEVSEKEIETLMQELAGLKNKIPVLKQFLVGKNKSPRGQGFQYAQVSVFEKEADLQIYEKHPEHQKLVRKIGPKLAGGLTMDFDPLL